MLTCSYPRPLTANLSPSLHMHFSSGRFFRPPADPRSIPVLISRRASAHLCTFLPFYIFTFRLWFLKAVFPDTRLWGSRTGATRRTNWLVFSVWNLSHCNIYPSTAKCSAILFLSMYFSLPLFSACHCSSLLTCFLLLFFFFSFFYMPVHAHLNRIDIVSENRNLNIWNLNRLTLLHTRTGESCFPRST